MVAPGDHARISRSADGAVGRPACGVEPALLLAVHGDHVAAARLVPGDGRTAYVTEGFTRDGYGNGITVVDLTDRRRPFEVVAGARPPGIAVL